MADTYDVITLAEARAALGFGASDTTRDTLIARVVTTASNRLDEAIGPVVKRTVTSEVHSGGSLTIELNHGPVSAVASVTEYQGTSATVVTAETAGTQPTDGFYAEQYAPDRSLMSGVLVRRVSGNDTCWYWGRGNIQVTYTAGRSESTGAVAARYKEAGVLILRNLWRPYENSVGQVDEYQTPVQTFPAFALPSAVKDLSREELQSSVGFG